LTKEQASEDSMLEGSLSDDSVPTRLEPTAIAAALLAGLLVYVTYHPSDSVAVERGDALWFAVIAIATSTIALARFGYQGRLWGEVKLWSIAVDVLACVLASWIMLAAFTTCPPGNLRMATNEAWLWVSGVAVFCASRRLMNSVCVRRAICGVLIACSVGVAVHALHQQWYSLPQSRAEYRADPDKLLAEAQIVAPPGSVERMIFENRLFDGGPTGTFALANSMAGFLVVGCLLVTGVTRLQWRSMKVNERVGWLVALAIGLLGLWMARSRSAMLACGAGMVAVTVVVPWLIDAANAVQPSTSNDSGMTVAGSKAAGLSANLRWRIFVGLGALVVAGIGVVSLVAAVGNKEWFEQAPQSLAFRFQYWRSTWAMAMDAPWFGSGPGNFQSIYQRYREESASEDIADAHNFLFETLAAGGFVGAVILVTLFVVVCLFVRRRWLALSSSEEVGVQADDFVKWVWLGGGLSLLMIWLIGAAAGHTPDFRAHMLAVPCAVAAAFLCWPAISRTHAIGLDLVSFFAIGSLLVHLSAAGGWSIPGVAVPIWMLGGMLSRTEQAGSVSDVSSRQISSGQVKTAVAVAAIGIALLLAHRTISLAPAEAAGRAMKAAAFARSEGQLAAMTRAVDAAVVADPWAVDASLYKADLLRWELIYRGDIASLRKQWAEQLEEALHRAGENPTVYRSAAQQSLHLYQRFGNRRDLNLADQRLQRASQWSPTDHSLIAQRAATAKAMGRQAEAEQLSTEAARLAKLGDNIERQLFRQMIYVVQPIGESVADRPRLAPATEVLGSEVLGAN
jgi:hypothetical protein